LATPDINSKVLEDYLARHFSMPVAVRVGRGALGLMAALRCWPRRKDACRVAVSGAVCHDVVVAILAAGCEPFFCDVDPADGLVTEAEWRRARSLGADVAIVVHLYGNPAPVKEVRTIFPAPECLVIDDAAQALGSRSADGLAGSQGDIGLLSFGYSKHIALGGAALLCDDPGYGAAVGAFLQHLPPEPPQSVRESARADFRRRLDMARESLCERGSAAAGMFSGLLADMPATLREPVVEDVAKDILAAFERYPQAVEARLVKARLWRDGLAGSGLLPVGMASGCVPWRYACRLPGASWARQNQLAAALRAGGMHVSNWYLPAHWFVGHPVGSLPGVESLAQEVFQFWLDEQTSSDAIVRHATLVRRALTQQNG
jgi:hypothetical protein